MLPVIACSDNQFIFSPSATPEDGVSIYECDHTQGPACSIACGPATVLRNYFVRIDGDDASCASRGQTRDRQINNASALLAALGPSADGIHVRNGYMMATDDALQRVSVHLEHVDHERLMEALAIGVHADAAVCLSSALMCSRLQFL